MAAIQSVQAAAAPQTPGPAPLARGRWEQLQRKAQRQQVRESLVSSASAAASVNGAAAAFGGARVAPPNGAQPSVARVSRAARAAAQQGSAASSSSSIPDGGPPQASEARLGAAAQPQLPQQGAQARQTLSPLPPQPPPPPPGAANGVAALHMEAADDTGAADDLPDEDVQKVGSCPDTCSLGRKVLIWGAALASLTHLILLARGCAGECVNPRAVSQPLASLSPPLPQAIPNELPPDVFVVDSIDAAWAVAARLAAFPPEELQRMVFGCDTEVMDIDVR